tara:strand:+ start:603 stop:752 length:150 start_codon:yes stop_codon:yes gene_type:complete
MPKLKRLKEGEPFPYDFWNYKINPILGYEHEPRRKKDKDFWKYQQPNNL